jgi:hypothetical protein
MGNRGITAPDYSNMGECLGGYQGFLCSDCQIKYAREGKYILSFIYLGYFECQHCPQEYLNAFIIIGIFFLLSVFLFFTIKFTIKNAKESRSLGSVYLRILMNHTQLIMLTASFQMDWPSIVK